MLDKILQWIKGVWNKMIGQNTLKQKLGIDIVLSSDMTDAIQEWAEIYENKSTWLVDGEVYPLGLGAAIASEIARAVTLEMELTCGTGARADYLQAQMDNLLPKLRIMAEYGCAKGGIIFKPYPKGDSVLVDYVQADRFYPTEFDANGNITGVVFADQRQIGNKYYTKLEYHHFGSVDTDRGTTMKGYVIENMLFKSTSSADLGQPVSLDTIPDWADIQPIALINVDKPLFAYFKYPLANTIDPTSPVGVSCFSRAVGLIEQADKIYSNLVWEFESGQRALYADVLAFTDGNGKKVLPTKRLYRALNGVSNPIGSNPEGLFHDWSPDFRDQSILSGLDAVLKKIEFQCGLSYGTISDPAVEAKTATEIKISRQRTYATIVDAQKSLEDALLDTLWAMDIWATLYKLAPAGSYKPLFSWDDSIIVDSETQRLDDMQAVSIGAMSLVEYRMRTYGEDQATATKWVEMVKTERSGTNMFDETGGN